MAIDKAPPDDSRIESGGRRGSLSLRSHGSEEKNSIGGGSLREQYLASNSSIVQYPPEPHHLPTPEASPSLRSSSPSLVVTQSSSAEWDGTLGSVNERPSESFEKALQDREDATSAESISSPRPISKRLPSHELHKIPEEIFRKPRKTSISSSKPLVTDDKVLKLSPMEIEELTGTPESLPKPLNTKINKPESGLSSSAPIMNGFPEESNGDIVLEVGRSNPSGASFSRSRRASASSRIVVTPLPTPLESHLEPSWNHSETRQRSPTRSAALYTPGTGSNSRRPSFRSDSVDPLNSTKHQAPTPSRKSSSAPPVEVSSSSMSQDIPIPPMSIPTYLQLELASSRPSPLYIQRSAASEYPYESSKVKFERLLNFLLLPPQLEHVLAFGTLACLDAWLHAFTILPLRFTKAVTILVQWWGKVLATEARFISGFIYHGTGRMWHRQRGRRDSVGSAPRSRSVSRPTQPMASPAPSQTSHRPTEGRAVNGNALPMLNEIDRKLNSTWGRKHRRTRSEPSALSPYHKADLLQGSVIICSCMILMFFDASRMYHSVRGQSAVKLYMIWNVLEVGDRLLAALGQDIFECLFSNETIERGPDGRSKLLRPFGMFVLALIYNVIHAAALFYQVITLNVAVNSYSNALLTLLMSNMFVEIKSTVFKKFEKDNIFQLTCADVVERFQLWLMLVIIGLRNIVEVGGLSITNSGQGVDEAVGNGTLPIRTNSILPVSFTILPNWTGEVLSPFLLVLGSEMIVDWLKHAYISKFNNVKPALYQKFLDVLAKDYYTNAFVNQNLTKRLGLPVIPLSCLFISASVQTYHMFLATHLPTPIPSIATALALETEATASPVTTAALQHFDTIIRRALGRSTFGSGFHDHPNSWFFIPGIDDLIAFITMLTFFGCAFLVLLACKLVLGMLLLSYARNRYSGMQAREHLRLDTAGKRVGGWGVVEVDEDKRRWIYEDDSEGARAARERDRKASGGRQRDGERGEKGTEFARVARYEMAAKRIW